MPHPVVYTGTQDDDQTRSVDLVHIEPSIREGLHLVSSLYGHDASSPLYRFPPQNIVPPYIVGPQQIPGRLVCQTGQWTGSPSPTMYYQWMRDGEDVPGANAYEYFTTEEDDNTVMTCEVRGANYLGEDYAMTSNSIAVSLIEPIEVREVEEYITTGISASKVQSIQDRASVIVTGIAAEDRQDVNRAVAYYITGRAAIDREDTNAMNIPVLTGLSVEDQLILQNDDGVMVVNYQYADPLVESVPVGMNIGNFNAEIGLVGWEVFGAVTVGGTNGVPFGYDGVHCWYGGDNVHAGGLNIPYSYAWQDVPIEPIWEADVDAELCNVEVLFFQRSLNDMDQANVKLEFVASNGTTILGDNDGPGLWASPSGVWYPREFEVAIPANTRYVRVIHEYSLIEGTALNAYIDQITINIRKGAKIASRDRGPDFDKWRVRFVQANSYSGVALSEMEFRSSLGGSDLASGGDVIAGSEGLGGLKGYAFDNMINTGYWAGELNGVAFNTAWLGYDFASNVKPRELAITARSGTNSNQVGRSFYVEGSDDGTVWIPVQYYDESVVGTFTSEQTKAFPISDGAFGFWTEYYEGVGYSYGRSTTSNDNSHGKGQIYRSNTRLNITHLRALITDQADSFNFRLQLFRVSFLKNGLFQPGMVHEVLEDISLSSPGSNSGDIFVEAACSVTHEFEVGDYFCVRFVDEDAASNPVASNEGRTKYISSFNDEPSGPWTIRETIVSRVINWNGDNHTITIGDTNPTGTGNSNFNWAVDFKGSVF